MKKKRLQNPDEYLQRTKDTRKANRGHSVSLDLTRLNYYLP